MKKKIKYKAMVANGDMDSIRESEKLGLELGEIFELYIDSIKKSVKEVGLK